MKSLLFALALIVLAPRAADAGGLADYLAAAHRANLDVVDQRAQVDEADARTDVERAARLPSLGLSAGYQRNQHESAATFPAAGGATREVVIVPYNQLDATLTLSMPLVDVATWKRIDAARASADAASAGAAAVNVEVDRAVVVAYYQWVAASALADAAAVNLTTAQDALPVVKGRVTAGTASQLDVSRATAEVAAATQAVADVHLALAAARRQLHTLTELDAPDTAPSLPDDTSAEAPLDSWTGGVARLPDVTAAVASRRADQVAADAAAVAWMPTVGAFASERVTNAAGFGSDDNWSAGLTVTWHLDLGTVRSAHLADTLVRESDVKIARATRDARDRITDAWDVVDARRAQVDADAAQVAAAATALEVAKSRAAAGLATPLDLLTAQRDAFTANVESISARADLAAARALLRLAAGQEPAS